MRDVMTLISRASTMRAGVLIRGEEGTGRQVAARAIHAAQNGGAFVAVNCAEHDADDIDAVLFGASGGGKAASGLERVSGTSVLHAARNGTLYLQHGDELPTRVQVRLARVLRDREAVVAESGETVALDVRPMAGVDPGFDHAVEEGRVRDDLFKRLSAIRIEMPPLRNRREDIPAIANFALREICARQRVPPKTLSQPALALLAALPWRGNAAELRTVLESIVGGLQGGKNIGLEDVLTHVRLDGGSVTFQNGGALEQARAKIERDYIPAVLQQHRRRISHAAPVPGLPRTKPYRKKTCPRYQKEY